MLFRSVTALWFILPASFTLGGMLGLTSLPAILVLTSLSLVGIAGVGYDFWSAQPYQRFAAASRALLRAANKLPENCKTLLQQFTQRATGLFALGHAASLQERMSYGNECQRKLRQLEKKGDALIARDVVGQHDLESVGWRMAFRARQLPKAGIFRKHFSIRSAELRQKLEQAAGRAEQGVLPAPPYNNNRP